jgi:RimJ/RimL family protein N-acetyltransferase
MEKATWLPAGWRHPERVELGSGHHLRPIRASDVDLDMHAVLGSQARLWSTYGASWGWPPATLTVEQDREDLAHHVTEMEQGASFNYALFDTGETELLGCVYVDPPVIPGTDAEISWWVVDWQVGGPLEAVLDELVPRWIAERWPFTNPNFPHNQPQGEGARR